MDISVNENIIEKVRLRDIFSNLKNIVAGNRTSEDEQIIDKKLQEIYKTEKELGATGRIEKLTKELEMQETPKKKRSTRNTENIAKINKPIQENINSKNNAERQEETQEEERQY